MVGLTGICDELFSYMGLPPYSCIIIPLVIGYYCGPNTIRDIKRIIDLNRRISSSNNKTNQLRFENDFLQSVKMKFGQASQQNNFEETKETS